MKRRVLDPIFIDGHRLSSRFDVVIGSPMPTQCHSSPVNWEIRGADRREWNQRSPELFNGGFRIEAKKGYGKIWIAISWRVERDIKELSVIPREKKKENHSRDAGI